MVTLLIVVHYLVSFFLIVIILVQHGKGADVGAAFGGSTQTVFGTRGAATFLHKLTVGAAVTFFLTSLALTYLSSRKGSQSIFSDQAPPVTAPPSTPAKPEPIGDKPAAAAPVTQEKSSEPATSEASEPAKQPSGTAVPKSEKP